MSAPGHLADDAAGAPCRIAAAPLTTLHTMEAMPPWMAVARAEAGVRCAPAGQSNPRITAYHAGTNIAGYDDKAAWCSSFVGWCLARVGIAGTGSALARSWLDWGEPLAEPRPGCITVLSRDATRPWTGHVGFYLRRDGDRLVLYGGNQLDCVCENDYPAEALLGHRWPGASAGTGC